MKQFSNSDSLTLLQLIQLLLTTPTRWREFRTNDTQTEPMTFSHKPRPRLSLVTWFHVNGQKHKPGIAASSGTPLFARHKLRRLTSNVTSLKKKT